LERFYERKIQATEFRVRREAYNEQLRALGCWRVFVHDPYAFACSSTTAPKKTKKTRADLAANDDEEEDQE
jgi:hypothetical protein